MIVIVDVPFEPVAGMLPVAVGIGEGSGFYRPLGIAVIGVLTARVTVMAALRRLP